jgi:hypothetical protein
MFHRIKVSPLGHLTERLLGWTFTIVCELVRHPLIMFGCAGLAGLN